jgi:hypothetical protein
MDFRKELRLGVYTTYARLMYIETERFGSFQHIGGI